jgi:hypothetical protein
MAKAPLLHTHIFVITKDIKHTKGKTIFRYLLKIERLYSGVLMHQIHGTCYLPLQVSLHWLFSFLGGAGFFEIMQLLKINLFAKEMLCTLQVEKNRISFMFFCAVV